METKKLEFKDAMGKTHTFVVKELTVNDYYALGDAPQNDAPAEQRKAYKEAIVNKMLQTPIDLKTLPISIYNRLLTESVKYGMGVDLDEIKKNPLKVAIFQTAKDWHLSPETLYDMSPRDIKTMAGTPSRQDQMMMDLISIMGNLDYDGVYKKYFGERPQDDSETDADYLRRHYG